MKFENMNKSHFIFIVKIMQSDINLSLKKKEILQKNPYLCGKI